MLEVLIAGAVGMVILYAIFQGLTYFAKSNKSAAITAEYTSLISSLNLVLSQPDLCGTAFRDASGNALVFKPTKPEGHRVSVHEIRIGTGPIAKLGTAIGGLKLTRMEIHEIAPKLRQPNRYVGNLVIQGEKLVEAKGPAVSLPEKTFPIVFFTKEDTDAIQACNGGSTGEIVKGPHTRTLAVSEFWTVPDGISEVVLEAWAGGGGGGRGDRTGGVCGAGGGGGAYFRGMVRVTPGEVIEIIVGSGGSAGTGDGSSGQEGHATRFGTYVVLHGGRGGQYVTASEQNGGHGGMVDVSHLSEGSRTFYTLEGIDGHPGGLPNGIGDDKCPRNLGGPSFPALLTKGPGWGGRGSYEIPGEHRSGDRGEDGLVLLVY